MSYFTNDPRLKPCPICEGHAHIAEVVRSFDLPSAYFAACDDQDCRLFECPGTKHYRDTVDDAVADWNAMRRCSDCTERQGYYLDAETILNQQERIRQLESKMQLVSDYNRKLKTEHDACFHQSNAAATASAGKADRLHRMIAERDELIRDFEHACGGVCVDCDFGNPGYPDSSDDMCLLAIRAREIGVRLWANGTK